MESLQDLFGLKGKVALVTGGSSGLGVEFANALAIAGADVAIVARRVERLEAVAEQVRQRGVRCLSLEGDVGDDAAMEQVVQKTVSELGGVDILVNNAGISDFGRAEKIKSEDWDRVMAINLRAPFRLSQMVAQQMIEQGRGGRMINISSIAGEMANSVFPTVAYCASKAGLTNMTRQMAVEWARYNITVNAIAPGWFLTEMNTDPRHGDVKPEYKEMMESRTPMGRMGQPGELMGALLYLASPASSYVTGTLLPVEGGWVSW